MIAVNSKKIIDLRMKGYRPDEMILISLVGKIDELNHTVFADPKVDYDWRWCSNLDVCVYASSGVDWLKTINAISESSPHFLGLWDIDRREGADFWRLPCEKSLGKRQEKLKMKLIPNPWCSIQNKLFIGELCN